MVIRELITKWGFETDSKELDAVEDKFENIYNFSTKLMQISGLALAAIITPAVALQDKITDAMTLSEGSAKQLENLEEGLTKKAIALSNALGIAGSEVAESFYDVISTGAVALSDDFNFLSEVALKMGKTVGMSASDSVEKLSDTVKGFGYEMDQASRVADVFFQASKNVATSVPLLTEAMREAGPTSQTLGMEIEETTAILSAFAESGLKGSASGTAFRQVMLKIGAPNKNAKESLAEFNTEVFDADGKMRKFTDILRDLKDGMKSMTDEQANANLKMLVGEEAFSKMSLLLAGNIDKIDDWEQSLINAGGALDSAFNIKMGSVFEQLKKFWIVLKNVGATLGGPLLKPLGAALKFFNELLISFVELTENHEWIKFVTIGIIGLTLAISTAVVAFVSLTMAITAASAAWALYNTGAAAAHALTWGWIALVIGAVVLGIVAWLLVLEELYGFFTGKYDTMLQDLVDNWDSAWGDNLNVLQKFLKWVLGGFVDGLVFLQTAIQKALIDPFDALHFVINKVMIKFNELKNAFKGTILKTLVGVYGKVTGEGDESIDKTKALIDIRGTMDNINYEKNLNRQYETAGIVRENRAIENQANATGSLRDQYTPKEVIINVNSEGLNEQQVAEEVKRQFDAETKNADNDLNNRALAY